MARGSIEAAATRCSPAPFPKALPIAPRIIAAALGETEIEAFNALINDVGPSLSLLLAMMIELVSAFSPAVLASYADATRVRAHEKTSAPLLRISRRELNLLITTVGIRAAELYEDYCQWCAGKQLPLAFDAFIAAFDELRRRERLHKIRKRSDRYSGIKLSAEKSMFHRGI